MKLLISPSSIAEARLVTQAGCPIIDIKNVDEGSLGAQPAWVIKQIIGELRADQQSPQQISVAIGDLPNKPGTISLAAYGTAQLAPDFIKAGLRDATCEDDAMAMCHAMVKGIRMHDPSIQIVISGYADYQRFGGVDEQTVVRVAVKTGADIVMLDTLFKDGKSLFDALPLDVIGNFVDAGHQAGLKVALAGSINASHITMLRKLKPDIIGVRGAVCENSDRHKTISVSRIQQFTTQLAAQELHMEHL